jgi:arsenate reductase (glutaredoxin)
MALTFYWYPNCGSCKKAKKWLDDQGLTYEEIDIVDHPPTKPELEKLYRQSQLDLKKFFNTSGQRYRSLGLKDKVNDASEEELLDLLASDGMLIKRPIITDGTKVTVRFDEEEFARAWK